MKKLTIYIPSYNRSASLLRQLYSLQSDFDKDKIQIIVRDNFSEDKGYVNIKNYCLKNNITYRRNSSNIGPELNQFEGFLEINNSEYLWILSDDDILQHNSLKVILNILETNNLDLIFFTHNQRKNLKLFSMTQRNFYEQHLIGSDGAGLLSYVIYRSDFIRNSISVGKENMHTAWPHLAILINSLYNKFAKSAEWGSKNIFLDTDPMPPSGPPEGYYKSYFGHPLLGKLLKKELEEDLLKGLKYRFSFGNWIEAKKAHIAKENYTLFCEYINSRLPFYDLFKIKIFFWLIIGFINAIIPFFLFINKLKMLLKKIVRP